MVSCQFHTVGMRKKKRRYIKPVRDVTFQNKGG